MARLAGATVVLRIEDHDRGRSRPEFDLAIAEDLAWLGFAADDGPVRQSDADAVRAYEAALDALTSAGRTYRCACSRATFAAWARDHGGTWTGRGCPSACRSRPIPADGAIAIRVDVGDGEERFDDILLGQRSGTVAPTGDLVARDRDGNWTYSFAVVVDDLRTGVDLVIRGDDLVDETPRQIRLGTLLGRAAPPRFLHHPLVRTAAGRKLSKSAGDVAVAELRAAGASASDVRAAAARAGKVPLAVVSAAAGARRE